MPPPLPVGLAVLLTHDSPELWRAQLRAELRHGSLVLVRTAPAPESALASVLAAYQDIEPPERQAGVNVPLPRAARCPPDAGPRRRGVFERSAP
jgi:hypothetical protein